MNYIYLVEAVYRLYQDPLPFRHEMSIVNFIGFSCRFALTIYALNQDNCYKDG